MHIHVGRFALSSWRIHFTARRWLLSPRRRCIIYGRHALSCSVGLRLTLLTGHCGSRCRSARVAVRQSLVHQHVQTLHFLGHLTESCIHLGKNVFEALELPRLLMPHTLANLFHTSPVSFCLDTG